MSSVAAENQDYGEYDDEAQAKDSSKTVSLLSHEEEIWVVDVVGAQVLAAHAWRVFEAGADSVENSFDLKLTTECLVIYDDTWESGWLILGLVSSSLIYECIFELGIGDFVIVCTSLEASEALINASLGVCKVEAVVCMSKS